VVFTRSWHLLADGDRCENHTKAPTWWHEEYWPSEDGFAAGYLTHEETITCILQAVNAFRTEDRGRFEKGHPDFERTVLIERISLVALILDRNIGQFGVERQ
jgi:hypothetical protein